MSRVRYDRREAERLTPLILAIGREVEDRFRALRDLGRRLRDPFASDADLSRVAGDMARQKRELRRAEGELRAHGAEVVGTHPMTLRVAVRDADCRGSLLLQLGPRERRLGA